jgi:GTPase SAR1 family protein
VLFTDVNYVLASDNYVEQLNIIKHNGSAVSVNFGAWDTAGGEDYWRLRFLAYPQTDCFILCFDISKPDQLEYIYTEWYGSVGSSYQKNWN